MKKDIYIDELDLWNGEVDVTDPCYDKDVWCRLHEKVKPGIYKAYYEEENLGEFGIRVSKLSIQHNLYLSNDISRVESVGTIGVDSGLAGFFPDKPDYTDKQWYDLCDNVFKTKDVIVYEDGICSSTGYGDGEYEVIAHFDTSNQIVKLVIIFIEKTHIRERERELER